MIQKIVTDQMFLKIKSTPATIEDLKIIQDMKDTMLSFSYCVGLAANMIGHTKQIMVMRLNKKDTLTLINPKIIKTEGEFQTEEGCLCYDTYHAVTRYRKVTVEFYDEKFKKKTRTFKGEQAQVVMHEMDHFEGKLV